MAEESPSSGSELRAGFRRILVFDDEAPVLMALKGYLETLDFEVDTADSPDEALRLLEDRSYAALVSDLDPGSGDPADGLGFLWEVRRSRPSLPVLILSGHGDGDTYRRAAEIGVRDFLVKPQALATVAAVLRDVIEAARDDA